MRTRYVGPLVALPLALALTACGGGGGGGSTASTDFSATPSGTLNGWAFDNADDVGQARMDYAKDELKGVTIKLDQTAFDAQKFTTRLAGGDVPDVVQMDRRYVTTYAAQNLITPLDKCFSAHDVDPDKQWYPFVVDDVRFKDQVWAVPQFYQPPAILLNTRVMDAAGVTPEQIDTSKPDELVAAIGKMYKESGGVPTSLGFDPVATGQAGLWVLANGGKLTDDAGTTVAGDSGELWIRTPAVMDGYLDNQAETAAVLVDGWFRTGDIARIDGEGYVTIVGRVRERIKRGGYSIFPAEVETVLLAHPAVAEAAVVAMPDPTLGEEVAAFVALRPGAAADAETLIAWCRERLAAFKYPRRVTLLDALPRSATGKVLKAKLV